MTELLSTHTIHQLSQRLKEPAWLTALRSSSLEQHGQLPWPHPSDEIWRRTNASLLDPMQGYALANGAGLVQSGRMNDPQVARLTQPLGDEELLVRADGAWLSRPAVQDVAIDELARAAHAQGDAIKSIIEADSLTPSERKLASLNLAFHHDGLFLRFPNNYQSPRPLRIIRLLSAGLKQASFPLTVIVVGANSSVTLVDEYVGVPKPGTGPADAHVINGRVELALEANATVRYVRIQRWHQAAQEFLLQRATLREGAQLNLVNINMGAQLSKAHVVTKLLGEHASSKIYGFVFGHGRQHIDQHTLQDHQAPHTMSDLLYKAALRDQSRMIYTGLIRIAKTAQQTDAFQSNCNLLLSRQAKVETVPMLEILADDVRCKHGATVGPVDEEQLFYLQSRGLPRDLAEQLLVMGFVDPIIQQVPGEALQQKLREEIEGNLR